MTLRIGNAIQGFNARRRQDLESRQQARTILSPDEVSGKYSPARQLRTTLGGAGIRAITPADIASFRKSVEALGAKARQGITADEALSLSRLIDVQRARTQIRYAMLARLQNGKLHLVTESGPASKVTRHFLNVEFTQYATALARPSTPLAAATWLVKESALRFECDCEHFRYFLRFVATAGGWVAGRAENGFPKLRNPPLDGACCKHLVRAFTDLQGSGGIRQRIAKMIEADRALINKPGRTKAKAFQVSQREADAMQTKRVRRIVVPEQRRGTALPHLASRADVVSALGAFAGKRDSNSTAITRALTALLNQPVYRT